MEIPVKPIIREKYISEEQYNTLMRELWEMRQIMHGYQMEAGLHNEVQRLFERQRFIERMLIKIGTRLFKNGIKSTSKL